jgi:hypothetical protein
MNLKGSERAAIIASYYGYKEFIKLMIDSGYKIPLGTGYYFARSNNKMDIVEMLKENGIMKRDMIIIKGTSVNIDQLRESTQNRGYSKDELDSINTRMGNNWRYVGSNRFDSRVRSPKTKKDVAHEIMEKLLCN